MSRIQEVLKLVSAKLGMRGRNLAMRDRAYMEQVTGQSIDPELWEVALRNTEGDKSNAARLMSEYAILKHRRDQEQGHGG